MIFEKIVQFWAKMVRLRRIVFSWDNRASAKLLGSRSEPSKNRKTLRSFYPKALIYVYAFFILLSPFAKISTAHAPVMSAENVAQINRQKAMPELRKHLRLSPGLSSSN